MRVSYSDLPEQFKGPIRQDIMRDLNNLVDTGDFTLGKAVGEFEDAWAAYCGVKYAIGVRSGTDALSLIYEALGLKAGGYGITVPNTFVATAASIARTGADLGFIDVRDNFLMHWERIKSTDNATVVVPVDWAGDVVPISTSKLGNAFVVRDSCQAIGATLDGVNVGKLGTAAAFSLHPLKNVNVWGDGGMVTTDDRWLADTIRLLRNHGMLNRDTYQLWGYNARLETIQAIVGKHVLKIIEPITEKRIAHAKHYDSRLRQINGVKVPERNPRVRHVYHLYQIEADDRDNLIKYLDHAGIEAKVHYPKLLPFQPAAQGRFKQGDFPNAERQSKRIVSLPVHQHLTDEQVEYVCDTVKAFYG